MSFAARVAHFAMAATVVAASFSVGGLTAPQSVFAATGESAQSAQSAASAASAQAASTSSAQQSNHRLSQRQRIVRITQSHLHANYRFGAEGQHNTFDCSGLVYAVFKEAGLVDKIGGIRRGARGYYHWFKRRGLASRTNPKPGDLVIWHKGKHIGIYIGNGEIISALNKKYGVRVHGLNFVSGFTAYLHVQLHGTAPGIPATVLVKTTVDKVLVRDGAGRTYDRVGKLELGATLTVLDHAEAVDGRKWFNVKLADGTIGWVASWLVTVVNQ